jgi:hypothetical protein
MAVSLRVHNRVRFATIRDLHNVCAVASLNDQFAFHVGVECETSSCGSAEEHAELSRETALTSASLQMKNELTSVAQYAVGQGSIMR